MTKLEFESPIKQNSQGQAFEGSRVVDPMLTTAECCRVANCSRSSYWRRVADGTFPQPVKIGHLRRTPHSEMVSAIERAKDARNAR